MAQFEVGSHAVAAQVEIAVLHTEVIAAVCFVLNSERRCGRLVKDVHLFYSDFYLSGRHLGVLRTSFCHYAGHLKHIFAPEMVGRLAEFRVGLLIEHKLGQAVAVTKIDECHSPHFPYALHPSRQCHGLPEIGHAQLAAIVISVHIVPVTNFWTCPHRTLASAALVVPVRFVNTFCKVKKYLWHYNFMFLVSKALNPRLVISLALIGIGSGSIRYI